MPVCFKADDPDGDCEILSEAQQALKAPEASFFFANAEGKGYYRSSYPPTFTPRLWPIVETGLSPEERISFIGDEWAKVRANKAPVGEFLNLAADVKDDSSADIDRYRAHRCWYDRRADCIDTRGARRACPMDAAEF